MGDIVGDILGGVTDIGFGIYDRYNANQSKKKANKQLNAWNDEATGLLDKANNQAIVDYNNLVNNTMKLSDGKTLANYKNMVNNYNPEDYIYNTEKFDKSNYNVEDYLNPNKDAIISDVMKNIQHTAAGAGLGHSSGAAQAMVDAGIEKSEQLQNDAYNRMINERNFDYGAYTDFINQQQNQLNLMNQMRQNQMNQMRGDLEFDQNNINNQYQMKQQMNQNNTDSRLSLGNSIANSRATLV